MAVKKPAKKKTSAKKVQGRSARKGGGALIKVAGATSGRRCYPIGRDMRGAIVPTCTSPKPTFLSPGVQGSGGG